MKPAQALTVVRKLARAHHLTVRQLPDRGKGSHQIYALVDPSGAELSASVRLDTERTVMDGADTARRTARTALR